MTDIVVSRIVFNDAPIAFWQVPQDAFLGIVAQRAARTVPLC